MAAKRHARARRDTRRSSRAPGLIGGALLAVAIVVGTAWAVWPRPSATVPVMHRPPLAVPYRQIATVLTHARATHLITGHASWFVRVRHGQMEVVVQDAGTHAEQVFPLTAKEQHQ